MKKAAFLCLMLSGVVAGKQTLLSHASEFNEKETYIAQAPQADSISYRAYLESQDAQKAKKLWEKAVLVSEQQSKTHPKDENLHYRLALAQFGLLNATMRDKDEILFEQYVDGTERNLENLIKGDGKWAEPKALLAALYGLKMGYSPWKGIYLGPKSTSLMEEALKSGPSSPLVLKLYGTSKLYTPGAFGGSVKDAIDAYEKAIQLYEEGKSSTKDNWYYIDTIALLGRAYTKSGEKAKAVATYEHTLQVEPEFKWVRDVLLPGVRS